MHFIISSMICFTHNKFNYPSPSPSPSPNTPCPFRSQLLSCWCSSSPTFDVRVFEPTFICVIGHASHKWYSMSCQWQDRPSSERVHGRFGLCTLIRIVVWYGVRLTMELMSKIWHLKWFQSIWMKSVNSLMAIHIPLHWCSIVYSRIQ